MELQVNINYSFVAENEAEAREKAQQYLSTNLEVKALRDSTVPQALLQNAKASKLLRKNTFTSFCWTLKTEFLVGKL